MAVEIEIPGFDLNRAQNNAGEKKADDRVSGFQFEYRSKRQSKAIHLKHGKRYNKNIVIVPPPDIAGAADVIFQWEEEPYSTPTTAGRGHILN